MTQAPDTIDDTPMTPPPRPKRLLHTEVKVVLVPGEENLAKITDREKTFTFVVHSTPALRGRFRYKDRPMYFKADVFNHEIEIGDIVSGGW